MCALSNFVHTTYHNAGGSSSGLSVVDPRGGKAAIDRIMAKQGVEGVAKGTLTIRFYKNGYVVEDGDLQSYDSEEGRVSISVVYIDFVGNCMILYHYHRCYI